MTFRVGQKVECIDAKYCSNCIRAKQVYTCLAVDSVFLTVDCCAKADPGIHAWYASRFRPIVERKTDISIFTAMLNPSKQGIDA